MEMKKKGIEMKKSYTLEEEYEKIKVSKTSIKKCLLNKIYILNYIKINIEYSRI